MSILGSSSVGTQLKPEQVEAACRLHASLSQWQTSDSALLRLHERLPGFDAEACLLKTVAVNAIYGTNVLAVVRMAKQVEKVIPPELARAGPELVEKIATLPVDTKNEKKSKKRKFISFAAKFCHFFVDEKRFPIYDEAARNALRLHLGKAYDNDIKQPYTAFCNNFKTLYQQAGLTCSGRELDHYLWLTGMYMRWLKQRNHQQPIVNEELVQLFGNPGRRASDLDAMLPSGLERTFK